MKATLGERILMLGFYGFLKTHFRAVLVGLVCFIAFEVAFISWQHVLQNRLLTALSKNAALSNDIIVSIRDREKTWFSRLTRVRVTIASTAYSDNPKDLPLSLDFDVQANFGPFGLKGDIYPVNTTQASAKFMGILEGMPPQASIQYSISSIRALISVSGSITPFDVTLPLTIPMVGPVAWQAQATQPIDFSFRYRLASHEASWRVSAAQASITYTDTSGSRSTFATRQWVTQGRLQHTDPAKHCPWVAIDLQSQAKDFQILYKDNLNAFIARFEGASMRLTPDLTHSEHLVNGRYAWQATNLHFETLQMGGMPIQQAVDLRDFVAQATLRNVPLALLTPWDSESFSQVMLNPQLTQIEDLQLKSTVDGQPLTMQGYFEAGLPVTGSLQNPTLKLRMEGQVPGQTLAMLNVLTRHFTQNKVLDISPLLHRIPFEKAPIYDFYVATDFDQPVVTQRPAYAGEQRARSP